MPHTHTHTHRQTQTHLRDFWPRTACQVAAWIQTHACMYLCVCLSACFCLSVFVCVCVCTFQCRCRNVDPACFYTHPDEVPASQFFPKEACSFYKSLFRRFSAHPASVFLKPVEELAKSISRMTLTALRVGTHSNSIKKELKPLMASQVDSLPQRLRSDEVVPRAPRAAAPSQLRIDGSDTVQAAFQDIYSTYRLEGSVSRNAAQVPPGAISSRVMDASSVGPHIPAAASAHIAVPGYPRVVGVPIAVDSLIDQLPENCCVQGAPPLYT
jgi:hypothetical protein